MWRKGTKALLVWSAATLVIFCGLPSAHGKRLRLLDTRNEYGGRTHEETYSAQDGEHREGILRIVFHRDAKGLVKQTDTHFLHEHAQAHHIILRRQFYSHAPQRKPVLTRVEFYYTPRFSDSQGIHRCERHYDEEGKESRADFHFTSEWEKRKNYAKLEVYYDDKGEITKQVYVDSMGRIIASEDRDGNPL
ncbi:MAG: hypothetical protein GX443_16590 [Deltaproteobacteria bacterium]|nr:hypothetical protein [Deltaproteobacteria bacterium]